MDDDPTIVKLVVHILEAKFSDRLSVSTVNDICSVQGLAVADQVDLCITDLDMPHVNGMKCLKQLKAANPLTQVIILTAHPTENAIRSAFALGADDYLLKPLDIELLCTTVDFLSARFQRYHKEIVMEQSRKGLSLPC